MADLNARILPLHTEVQGRQPDDITMSGLGKDPIDVGEIVLNLEDGLIFSKKTDGTIVTLGGSGSSNNLLAGDFQGQALVWDGTAWVNGPVIGGLDTDLSTLASFVTNMEGNATNVAAVGGEAATYIGSASFDTSKPLFGSGSVQNPGAGSRVEWDRSTAYSLDQSEWTLEFWMNSNGTLVNAGEYILNATAGGDGNAYAWQGNNGNYWSTMVGDTTTTFKYWTGTALATATWTYSFLGGANRWVHVAFQVDNNQIFLWLDGVSQGAQAYSKTGDPTGLSPKLVFANFEEDTDGNPIFEGWLGGVQIVPGFQQYTPGQDFTVPDAPFGITADFAYNLTKLEDVEIDRTGLRAGQTLVYDEASSSFINAFSRLQDLADFSLSSAVPPVSQWSSGSSANAGEYSVEADHWLLNVVDQTTNDRTQTIEEADTTGILYWSTDGISFAEIPYTALSLTASVIRIDFDSVPSPGALVYVAFNAPGTPSPYPLRQGDTLRWDATDQAFKPIPFSSLGISIDDLVDVNTVTAAPTDGQALVWDDVASIWKPGDVATDASTIPLADLSDTTFTSLADGQVIRYDGIQQEWVNEALDYSIIDNTPTIPATVGDLTDTDLSTAPVNGQVLTWDGTAWVPQDPTGGSGGNSTTGAITERADITAGVNLDDELTGDLDFTGLGEAGSFVQVTTSAAAWVRFYPTASDRAADVTRQEGDDPLPGSGVLLEIRTTSPGQVVKITPAAIYYNNDSLPEQTLYARVTNRSGATALVNVTVRAYTQTDTQAISGGIFGSG